MERVVKVKYGRSKILNLSFDSSKDNFVIGGENMANKKLENLKMGETRTITTNGKNGKRKVTFKRVAKKGERLQFRIVKNVKA